MPPAATMSDRLESIRETLQAQGQAHVLACVDDLDPQQRASLLAQLESVDLIGPQAWLATHPDAGGPAIPSDLEPAPFYPNDPGEAYDAATYRANGEELIRAGRIAAFTVAGGQGTRLGWSGPKGTYPATVVTGKPLFRVIAEQIIAAERRYGVVIPWYIMTSLLNDAETRDFFLDNNCFGLMRSNIFLFPQGVVPSFDAATGKLLLAERHELAVNPDGHGGSLSALHASGAVEDMQARGVEHISYVQVDNPLVRVIDPLFIGLHAGAPDSSAEMSSKMVAKTEPSEKVGVFGRSGKTTQVIEYTDLPEEMAQSRDARGGLRFKAGSIAVHLIATAFVNKLTLDDSSSSLPWHRANKIVPHIDLESGELVQPQSPNAIKLEKFIFDALPLAESSIVFETLRAREFAPIKNRDGQDSPATSHQIQSDRNGSWLEAHDVVVARDDDGHVQANIEISPLTATEPADLVAIDLPKRIDQGENVSL